MKKYRTRIITLLLAGMLAVFAPVQAWAAETDEKEVAPGISQEEDSRETGEKENASKEPEEVLEEPGEVTEPITKADKPYLALGANLTPAQQETVLELLNINPAELPDYDVIYITNEEEHEYLGEYVDAGKIGTRALSCADCKKRSGKRD